MRGRIEEVVYRGSDLDLMVRITDSMVIRARQTLGGPALGPPPGAGVEVTVSWAADAARLLPA